MADVKQERVAKLMAQRGLCSRREAERLIEAGQVLVDGRLVCEPGCKAPVEAEIRIAAAGAATLTSRVTVALHKPAGVVSTQPQRGQVPAWRLLRADNAAGPIEPEVLRRVLAKPWTLAVAGRLDRDSRGLLVLTQDGTIARRIVGGHGVKKTYTVRTAEPISDTQVRKLCGPLTLDGQRLLPMEVCRLSSHVLRFVLAEGRKHQIRRVCRKVGLHVVDLFREAVGPIRISDLPEGRWRVVSEEELEKLRRLG